MPRIPHAAKQLIAQVQQRYNRKPDSKAGRETGTPVGEPDGLGVIRSVEFDKTSSKYLREVLPHLHDPRVIDWSGGDRITVHFASGNDADRRDEFPLDAAKVVADDTKDKSESDD